MPNQVAGAICDLMRERSGSSLGRYSRPSCTAELTRRVGERVAKTRGWPVKAQTLSRRLNRLSSVLRPAGIAVECARKVASI